MARMNLLPWREEKRKRQSQLFGLQLAGGIAATVLGCFLYNSSVNEDVNHQNQRLSYLRGEISALEAQLSEIAELESTKGKLLSRMNIIQELQAQRPQVVHLFHEVASAIPTGIRLSELNQKDEQLVLRGVTQSNARVSEFMRMLDASEWMTAPSVRYIEAERDAKQSKFELILKRTAPGKEGDLGAGDYQEESFNG